jgi:hypothetical protein
VRRLPLLVLLWLVVLPVGACSDDDDDKADEPTTTTTEEPSTTTATTEPSTTSSTCPPPAAGTELPLASIDLDGDGVDEVWRPAGSGAAVDIVELRRLEGCSEVPVLLEGGPAQFAVGGSVLLLQGIRCEGGLVVHLGATSEDGETYATLDLFYELRDGALVRVDDETGRLPATDPDVGDYSSFDC